jgi:hypothetical protein
MYPAIVPHLRGYGTTRFLSNAGYTGARAAEARGWRVTERTWQSSVGGEPSTAVLDSVTSGCG